MADRDAAFQQYGDRLRNYDTNEASDWVKMGKTDRSEGHLTPDGILDAAETVLRRFGPKKASVVDVARALGVSHGSIYRHFPSKKALRDAVAGRWLSGVSQPLSEIVDKPGEADTKLSNWLRRLVTLKQQKVKEDPELFATYRTIAESAQGAVSSHMDEMVAQLAQILAEGREQGRLTYEDDPMTTARALFDATVRFHHPLMFNAWQDPDIDRAYETVEALLMKALTSEGEPVAIETKRS
ncbi:MAG: TetR family transcriptional regulator [Pseudomonadota bacterium]